jgi:ribosomal subunit interface protein
MQITVTGKSLDVGDALRLHVEGNLSQSVAKYFSRALDSTVVFSRDGHHLIRADITVHAKRAMMVKGQAAAADAYAAFDDALERIAKQLRRYKRRIHRHSRNRDDEGLLPALSYVVRAESGDGEVAAEAEPAVIAEMPTEIATLTVGEAVMRMDLADAPALMFRNRGNGALNVVYRRPDGNVGWIDPGNVGLAGAGDGGSGGRG